MELVDPAFVEEAASAPKKNKKIWIRWCAAAACICLVIGSFAAGHFNLSGSKAEENIDTPASDNIAVNSEARSILLEGNDNLHYFPISFEDRVRYNLVPEGTMGLSPETTYKITEADLGEKMGTVTVNSDDPLSGADVYHFAKFPNYDTICIVDTPQGYAFYTADYISLPDHIGYTSDEALAAYGLPASAESVRILSPDSKPLGTVENTDDIDAILEILSGKTNSGLEANERRFGEAWLEYSGNDDFYFSEEDGCCVARDVSVYDEVTPFILNGERLIEITTNKGFRITIDFFPCIRSFVFGNGYYELSPEESTALTELLNQ